MKIFIIMFLILFTVLGCVNYNTICDANENEGWIKVNNPTLQMKEAIGDSVPVEGKIVWFQNADGRVRACSACPTHKCAGSYSTSTQEGKEIEVLLSTCPNPY